MQRGFDRGGLTLYLWGFVLHAGDLLQPSLTKALHPVLHFLRLLKVFSLRLWDLVRTQGHAASDSKECSAASLDLVRTCHPERKTNIAVSCILKSPLQRLFSYLLNQPVDLQLLLSFVHLFFLLGEFQLELHLLLVFSLLLQRVCVGSFLLFLLLFSFLGGQRLVKIKRNICHSEPHTARHAETASDSTQQTTLWIMNMKPRLCHDDIKTS